MYCLWIRDISCVLVEGPGELISQAYLNPNSFFLKMWHITYYVHSNAVHAFFCCGLIREVYNFSYSSWLNVWHRGAKTWWRHQMKTFPRYWPPVRGILRSPGNSPHKGQWLGALMLSFICAWINGWVNNREVGDLRHHRAHYDVIVTNS